MAYDIKQHAKYIAEKIRANHFSSHSFYFYILPFDYAEAEKKTIMENVMNGDVMSDATKINLGNSVDGRYQFE